MAQPHIQHSFHTGEWAPALNARVDLAKYHSAAALMRNFYVDYRGGASSRPGTKYIIKGYNSSKAIRLIPFQASFTVGYMLEFGENYIRFIYNGAPVLETGFAITAATKASPCVITSAGNNFTQGQWVYVTGVIGMTQLNGRYFQVLSVAGAAVSLGDLFGAPIDSTGFSTYVSGGTVSRIYTLPSPYAAVDLALLKFTQNVDSLIICNPNYQPYVLTLISANNWTITPIVFGTTAGVPTGVAVATTLAAGGCYYSYVVTSVDVNGQESASSTAGTLASMQDIRTVPGTNTVTWTAVSGAVSYNVYRAEIRYSAAVPSGAAYGFLGNATGVTFIDSNINPDFSQSIPIAQNPFQGASIISIAITAPGAYTTVPTVIIANAPAGGQTATAAAVLQVTAAAISATGSGYTVGQTVSFGNGVILIVASIGGGGTVTGFQALTYPGTNPGYIASGSTPGNPVVGSAGTGGGGTLVSVNLTWGVGIIQLISGGSGYTSVPAVTFSSGAATATAVLGPASAGNPSVPGFYQQRLVLAAQVNAPQSFDMSQPGSYYNYNITNPIRDDDAISAAIVSGSLNEIKSMVPMPSGLIMLTSNSSYQINGGGANQAVTPANIVANAQSHNGASDVPPIVANFDILFVQAKGSIVRDITYNFYANIFTGTDISVLSSHLFYGYTILEWAWAEEPFKLVWAVRNDGTMLTLTYMKEQELIGWAHSDTPNGLFKSVATVTETVNGNAVDAVYTVVERVIEAQTVKYIERVSERLFNDDAILAWTVDCGLRYSGAPATAFSGAEHLAGQTVTGLADGVPITPFVMPVSGLFTLPAASVVTIGLQFTPQLQTLQLDLGEPTIQGKRKKITGVSVRCQQTLGLKIGKTFSSLVVMKDLVLGSVGTQTNAPVTGLVTGDAWTIIDPDWNVQGQYCIEQSTVYPATILGVIPNIVVGDTK